jgi:4-amino-4-deoxy-L-arabinose transferase-like glycosyltransferase
MRFQLKFRPTPVMILMGILVVAAGWKALLLALGALPFNADEAVVALMARHILQGERPIFFYGQAYMGSLDAFLVAGGFLLFGQQVWVIRLVQALLYLGLIITTIGLGKEACGSWKVGFLAALLMAIPTVNVTLYTTASLGGYGEALLLGNLILYSALRIANKCRGQNHASETWLAWPVFGLLAGLGLWANGLTLIYSLPAAILLLVVLIQKIQLAGWQSSPGRVLAALVGFLTGSLPWWIFAITQGWQNLVTELLGSAVAVEQETWLVRTFNHLINFILLGGSVTFGLRPPWEIRWLGLPLLPFVLIAWLGIIALAFARLRAGTGWRGGRLVLLGMVLALSGGFIFTSFGVDPSGRYFLPLVVPLSLAAAAAILSIPTKTIWQAAVLLLLLGYQAWGTLDSALRNPPGITTQFNAITQVDLRYQDELIQFLKAQGETRGYSNYWVAYPTAFLSGEELIFVPRLPYHTDLGYTSRDDRYAPYDAQVAASPTTAYITTLNPKADQKLTAGLTNLGVTWQERQIGDYTVYYHLSRAVRPVEIGFGVQP